MLFGERLGTLFHENQSSENIVKERERERKREEGEKEKEITLKTDKKNHIEESMNIN